ncbi:FAD-binding oxidoreductase [Bacteroidota bacterium]
MIIKTEPDEIQNYLIDASNFKGCCEAVYFPENEKEVIDLLKYANSNGKKITIAGNGTGLTGARVPEGGLVIAMERLDKILDIDVENKNATVQSGVILRDFKERIESLNLYYPPDPTELNCCIGATIVNNSSGARTFKYGPTRNYVMALNIILPDGEKIVLNKGETIAKGFNLNLVTMEGKKISLSIPEYFIPETKNAAGYYCKKNMDAIDLFVGSEGTLGIITEVKLKLLDLPKNFISVVAFFNYEQEALNFLFEARILSGKSGHNNIANINASGLEYFDFRSLDFLINDYPNIPSNTKAAIWFEQATTKENEDIILSLWVDLLKSHNVDIGKVWTATNKKEKEVFEEFRHSVSWKVVEYISKYNVQKVGTDTAVPENKFIDYYDYCTTLVEKSGIKFICYGHFGNSHLHLNMLPTDNDEYLRAKELYSHICRKAITLKGTISAEHGIGKIKREYLLEMYGEEIIKKMAALKTNLDPNLILNIGNIFHPKYL